MTVCHLAKSQTYLKLLQKYELETSNLAKDKKQLQFEVDRLLATVKALSESYFSNFLWCAVLEVHWSEECR